MEKNGGKKLSKNKDVEISEKKVNIISRIFLFYTVKLFKTGYSRDLTPDDVLPTRQSDLSDKLADELEEVWQDELEQSKNENKPPSLSKVLVKVFWYRYMLWGLWVAFMYIVLWPALPFTLALFIGYFSEERTEESYKWAHINGFLLNFITLLQLFVYNHLTLGQAVVGMQARIACCSLMYRKLLRLSNKSLNQTAPGQIVNLMSNDVRRLDDVAYGINYIILTIPLVIILSSLVWQTIQIATLAVLLVIALESAVFQGYLTNKLGSYRERIAKRTDERVKVMSELVNGIHVVKMYTWEKPFATLVHRLRKYEIKLIKTTATIKGLSSAFSVFTERFNLFVGIVTYLLLGGEINAQITFSLLQYFNLLQMGCSIHLPNALGFLSEARASIKRIEDFLALEELPRAPINVNASISESSKGIGKDRHILVMQNISASWVPNPITNTLRDISLNVVRGKFIGIAGPVGCGKSSLLQIITGELPLINGTIWTDDAKISYASQEPWLFVDSVRENILFGEPYDKDRYGKVINACALHRDFKQFPHKDQTLVGERGVSLSGGQRARIGLARAVYRQADIYLLDDPLSAVDTKVGKHILTECIQGYLKNHTRILVTHQLHHLKTADTVVIMRDGEIEVEDSFEEVSKNEHFSQLLKEEETDDEDVVDTVEIYKRARTASKVSHLSSNFGSKIDNETKEEETDELMEKGSISTSVYTKYFSIGNGCVTMTFLIASMIIGQVVTSASDMWLPIWMDTIEDKKHNATSHHNTDLAENFFYSMIWLALILGCIILTTKRSIMFCWVCMRSSVKMHDKMFSKILKAPMRFFDTNPSGRILNRFSKDMGTADEVMPRMMLDSIQIFLVLAGILVNVAILNPYMLVTTLFCAILMYFLTKVYLKTAQAAKRIEGANRSPVFSHITASMDGLTTIRSCENEEMLKKLFDQKQDVHTAAWYTTLVSNNAFSIWLSIITWSYLLVASYTFLLYDRENSTSGNVGLTLSCSLTLVNMIQYGIRQGAETLAQMTCVERILQYTKLPQEYPLLSPPGKKPPNEWPAEGKIDFKNVYLRYEEEAEPVLKNLSFTIRSGWKVGVVGRTGAGKSSLIAALFRLAKVEGDIIIDGYNTKTIGLKDLRCKLSIIPQEPVLFSATLRYNLDPFNNHSDADIWKALEQVELKSSVSSLAIDVNAGGNNFSAGQRQLICLARAILSHNRILVMDEATANVDPQTDTLIQKTIREYFNDCTVITVAHRLHTVADSDRVLVMEQGQMVQWGHPHLLLQEKDGAFSVMVSQLGTSAESSLREIAKRAFESINKDKLS